MEDVMYDEHARLERDHWWFSARRAIVSAELRRQFPAAGGGRTILDVGCGTGGMLPMLAQFGSVSGLEMSPRAIAWCRELIGDDVDVRLGRAPDDIVPADVITTFDVIEHLDDDVEALVRIHDALPPGGTLVCTVPAYQFLWSDHDVANHHRRRYTRSLLRRRLREAGFEVERISYFNTLLFPAVAAVRLVRGKRADGARTDMAMPSKPVNAVLRAVFASERFLLRFVPLPFGLSLLAVGRKRGQDAR